MVPWWCRLESQQGESDLTALAQQARDCGIQAWVIAVDVDGRGGVAPALPLQPLVQAAAAGGLPFCLLLHLRAELTPQGEETLAQALAPWLQPPWAARLCGRPALVIAAATGMSHPQFGPQRLRCSLQRHLQRLGQPVELPCLVGPPGSGAWDANLNSPLAPVDDYRQHLRRAHHGAWPAGPGLAVVHPPHEANDDSGRALYAEWLAQAGALSRLSWNGQGAGAVLVESWSGHRRWWTPSSGATRAAQPAPLPATADAAATLQWGTTEPQHLALLVHGFYLERLGQLLALPPPDGDAGIPPIDLYLSTPTAQLEAAAELLHQLRWPRVRLFGVENRGRDMAPFVLQLLPAALATGHRFFVKVHTKQSSHLGDGLAWSEHLLQSLLPAQALRECLCRLQQDPRLGLLAPAGTLLPCTLALHANEEHLLNLQTLGGGQPATLLQQRFIAGSMMAGRLAALEPLTALPLRLEVFEPEQGQTDGTLAHALERWLCGAAADEGWQLQALPGDSRAVPGFGHGGPLEWTDQAPNVC